MTVETLPGALRSDGTLELDAPPRLPPGPVEVRLRVVPSAGHHRQVWWEYLLTARNAAEQERRPFRSAEQVEAERAAFREERGDQRATLPAESDSQSLPVRGP
jgi:hypothetical protein